jgi:hypothetical protein
MANENSGAQRGWFLTAIAVLFVLLAISDFLKPIGLGRSEVASGIVEFGHRFHGLGANVILGILFGIFFLTYAYGLWNLRAWVLPISIVYAFYMPANAVLFWAQQMPGRRSLAFIVVWLAVALTGSVGTAIYLAYHRERLT